MKPKLFYRISISIIILFFAILFIRCQESQADVGGIETNDVKKTFQEKKDWEKIKTIVLSFCDYPEECEKYNKDTFWNQRNFEEHVYKNRLHLTQSFLKNYPNSEHYFEALKFYFSYLVEPWFMDSIMNDSKKLIVDQYQRKDKDYNSHKYQQFRTLPYNYELREKWLHEGDSLVQNFLSSEYSLEEKAIIEIAVLGRDLRIKKKLLEFLYLNKKEEEAEYWLLFDQYYWDELINRVDKLMFKYPDYSKWPKIIDQFIGLITPDHLSPELTEYLWEHFQKVTENPKGFENKSVIAQVHKKAEENLKAMEIHKVFDESQPLQMKFISMDGKKIDLQDYRGKVVLLDFWSIRCAPCIQEMPHVRALYDKYGAQGFEVIGISAEGDEDKERVLGITQKQGANWPQLLDKSADVVVSYHSLFKIDALPNVWLLNKEGIIVDKHARGSRLEPLIKKYLELD